MMERKQTFMCSTLDYRRNVFDNTDFECDESTTTTSAALESCFQNHSNIRLIPRKNDDQLFEDDVLSLLKDEYIHHISDSIDNQHKPSNNISGFFMSYDIEHMTDHCKPYILHKVDDDNVLFSDTNSKGSKTCIVSKSGLDNESRLSPMKKLSKNRNKLLATSVMTAISIQKRGDIRMNRAIVARLHNPRLSLFEALIIGGFVYPSSHCNDPNILDSEKVTLGQLKNQLSRRLRLLRVQQQKCRQEQQQNQQQQQQQNGIASNVRI